MRVLLKLDQLPEPREVVIQLVGALAVFLVQPVGGDTVFGRAVHVARADLDLIELSARPKDGGVQRLIAVRLGARDIVLDPLLQRRPRVVNDAQHVVAVGDAIDEHADRQEIVNLLERLAALLHLLEDRPHVLGPPDDVPTHDSGTAQLVGERRAHPLDRAIALDAPRLHLPRQLLVVVGLQILEREILELGLHTGHPEAVGERGVQLARLLGDPPPLLRGQRIERAHVVEPVGELDDDDARIARHRHQQLAIVLGLLLGGRTEGQRLDLGQAIDEIGDLVPEVLAQAVQRDVGVFDDVVQQRRRDRRGVHLLLGQDGGDRDAMRDVVVAGEALLPMVRLRAHLIGARQHGEVEPVVLRRDRLRQLRGQNRRACRARHNSPASAKLTNRSPPPPRMTWSYTGISSNRPASTSCRVTARSSAEGVGSPLG